MFFDVYRVQYCVRGGKHRFGWMVRMRYSLLERQSMVVKVIF